MPDQTIRIVHADQSVWHVPAKTISHLRAERLDTATSTSGEVLGESYDELMEKGLEEPALLLRWVLCELDWGQIEEYATKVGQNGPERKMSTAEAAILTEGNQYHA